MRLLRDKLEEQLIASCGFQKSADRPRYLDRYEWAPEILLRDKTSSRFVGFEIVRTKTLALRSLDAAAKAQAENNDFAVAVLANLDVAGVELESLCKEKGFELYVFTSSSITLLLPGRISLERKFAAGTASREGWIPDAIAEHASEVESSKYADVIREVIPALTAPDTELDQAVDTVKKAVSTIMDRQQKHLASRLPFYRLGHFEGILRLSDPEASEHVIHSFRVYVAGSVIIEHFRKLFEQSWGDYLDSNPDTLEDTWFLMSLFHDCGYAKELKRYRRVLEVLELSSTEGEIRPEVTGLLSKKEYQMGTQILSSLLAHIGEGTAEHWDFGAVPLESEDRLQQVLLRHYEQLSCHGIIGALDLVGKMLLRVRGASDETSVKRRFLASCVYPAAAGIALHDWRAWEDLTNFGLFPLHADRFPLGALLIYIDTWDDYRRRVDNKGPMQITSLDLCDAVCTVRLEWLDPGLLARQKVKYNAYNQNMLWSRDMSLKIAVGNRAASE